MISQDGLERILELRRIIAEKDKVGWGDKHVTELNELIYAIPEVLSREEFIKCCEQYSDKITAYRSELKSVEEYLQKSRSELYKEEKRFIKTINGILKNEDELIDKMLEKLEEL